MGRYGSSHNNHNFQDMDYRGYSQEDEVTGTGFDVGAEEDRPHGCKDQSLGVFVPSHAQDHLGFHQKGDGKGDVGHEGKGLLWPPCSQLQPDRGLPILQQQKEEGNGSRMEFETLWTGPQERGMGKGGRGFPENTTPHLGSREDNWGCGGVRPEPVEYNNAKPREEDRFSRGAGKRRVCKN